MTEMTDLTKQNPIEPPPAVFVPEIANGYAQLILAYANGGAGPWAHAVAREAAHEPGIKRALDNPRQYGGATRINLAIIEGALSRP